MLDVLIGEWKSRLFVNCFPQRSKIDRLKSDEYNHDDFYTVQKIGNYYR